ncbi:MAG: YdcF family protein [Acidobacteria bacterium]|nr:YdcF family protein [Acidobacteriota bacterium]
MTSTRFILTTLFLAAASLIFVHFNLHRFDGRIITNLSDLDTSEWARPRVAVVFGASVFSNGELSPVLEDRVDTAIKLYQAKKVDRILVSGDNRHRSYNEPRAMQEYLISHAIASKDVIVDNSGRSTYETCLRAKEVFGLKRVVLVSQSYHLSRALYIANELGLDAVGMAGDLRVEPQIDYQNFREWAAEIKAFMNIHLISPNADIRDRSPIR